MTKTAQDEVRSGGETLRRGHAVTVEPSGARKVDVRRVLRSKTGQETLRKVRELRLRQRRTG